LPRRQRNWVLQHQTGIPRRSIEIDVEAVAGHQVEIGAARAGPDQIDGTVADREVGERGVIESWGTAVLSVEVVEENDRRVGGGGRQAAEHRTSQQYSLQHGSSIEI
jgi:hypothetical protein